LRKPELLAPAGDLDKLKVAILYGADAVFLGGQKYGLRAFASNFTTEEMKQGVEFAHKHGAKVYVTVNMFPRNEDFDGLSEYFLELQELGVDAIIVADPGVFQMAKQTVPQMPIHISTQANTTNWVSAQFWQVQGANRIVLARELSQSEIREIKEKVGVELEVFVHGALCISYSGRCLLSNYMTHRDANKGECAQACRWKYALVEEKRPGQYYPVVEDERGTYIFNSQDLCLIDYIPQLITSGADSFKIEGRMKSIHYVATIVNAYRHAIDQFYEYHQSGKDLASYEIDPRWKQEILKVSHRDYTTGFFTEEPANVSANFDVSYIRKYDFVGLVLEYDEVNKSAIVEQRNKFSVGDEIEIIGRETEIFTQKVGLMWDKKGEQIDSAPHAQQIISLKVDKEVRPYDLIRRWKEND